MGARSTYKWLLNPLQPGEFEKTYYQRELCVVHRHSPEYFADLLRIDDLDDVLASHGAAHPDINLVSSEREIPPAEYTGDDGRIDPIAVGQLFGQGATVIFTHLHRRVSPLAEFCGALSSVLSAPMQANVYFTPAGAQGFPAHWDTHDVFVLQVTGTKRWTIFDTPIALPLRGQEFDHKLHKPGAVSKEFELCPGDWAYIPRGLMHSAKSSDEASLHITAGIMGLTWADFFLEAVAAAAIDHAPLREHLPIGFADPERPSGDFPRFLAERLALFSEHVKANPPLASLAAEVAKKQKPMRHCVLRNVLNKDKVVLTTRVRRVGAAWDVREEGDACIVDNGDREMRLPQFVRPALEFLNAAHAALVTQIPDCVDDAGKLTLVRRLTEDGFIELIGPARQADSAQPGA